MRTLKDWLAAAPRERARLPGLERLAALETELAAQRTQLLAREEEAAAQCRNLVDEEVAAARQRWVQAEAEELAALIQHQMTVLEERLAAAVEAVLTPFLDSEVRGRAVADFAALLRRHLADGGALTVTGPGDLLDGLRAALGEAAAMVTFVEGPGADLSAQAGSTRFASAVQEWRDRLAGGAA